MLSFIMPAKNEEKFIEDAIEALLVLPTDDWELIVIDDHSTDKTAEILEKYSSLDNRIRPFKNTGKGKVQGLNYGYSKSRGELIKCIDSDDVLDSRFFECLPEIDGYQAHCHAAFITDQSLNKIAKYNINTSIINQDYQSVLENLISLPRWSWTFTRNLGEKIFPMPETLPFEDVWFSLTIKKFSQSIISTAEPLYYYRQHQNQTFGGILNFDKETVIFRANRMLTLIEELRKDKKLVKTPGLLDGIENYYKVMAKDGATYLDIMNLSSSLPVKLKLTLIKKHSTLAKWMSMLKWKLDKLK